MNRWMALILLGAAPLLLVAAGDGGRGAPLGTTRFRVAVLKVPVAGPDSVPLRLSDLEEAAEGAFRPRAGGPRAEGLLASLPYSKKIRETLLEREGARVLYRGELENSGGQSARWSQEAKIPVTTVSFRGNQKTVATSYVEVGAELRIKMPATGDLYETWLQFSAMPQGSSERVDQVATEGTICLPDGFTGVFSYFLRDASNTAPATPEVASSGGTQYFVLLTRVDFEK